MPLQLRNLNTRADYIKLISSVIGWRHTAIVAAMLLLDRCPPPSHITTLFKGMAWPPNRPATVGRCTLVQWQQQRPHVDNPSRRPMPAHFRRAFAILGWREAANYYRANWRVICRWVNEAGKESLLAERAAMRCDPDRHRLKASMAAYWTSEPRDPVWMSLGK